MVPRPEPCPALTPPRRLWPILPRSSQHWRSTLSLVRESPSSLLCIYPFFLICCHHGFSPTTRGTPLKIRSSRLSHRPSPRCHSETRLRRPTMVDVCPLRCIPKALPYRASHSTSSTIKLQNRWRRGARVVAVIPTLVVYPTAPRDALKLSSSPARSLDCRASCLHPDSTLTRSHSPRCLMSNRVHFHMHLMYIRVHYHHYYHYNQYYYNYYFIYILFFTSKAAQGSEKHKKFQGS